MVMAMANVREKLTESPYKPRKKHASLDGNLTNDLVWALKWDGENRLIEATNVANVPNAGKKKLTFTYDHLGRRVRKTVFPWSGSNYSTTPSEDLQFVYDGWNLLAELNQTNKTVLRSYAWGSDLSGDMESAGGIGGLVMQRDHSGAGSHHFAGYDGNGNVTALVSGADSAVTAVYEHGPFGEPIRASGTQAKTNPFRWSTKFTDGETDLVYYGYRYYSASLGRWINRDPAEERGGMHLYCFVLNSPPNYFDTDGRWPASLSEWGSLGGVADLAYYSLKLTHLPGGEAAWLYAVYYVDQVDLRTDGAVLGHGGSRYGGAALFGMLANPWVGAAVVAKLKTVGKVGQAARAVISGQTPNNPLSTEGLAVSFLQHSRSGDTAFADLDSAVLAQSLAFDNAVNPVGAGGLLWALKHHDHNAIASALPSYTALFAWEMLQDMSPFLEGL